MGKSGPEELIEYLGHLYDEDDIVGYVMDSWDREGKWLPKSKGCYSRTAGDLMRELKTRVGAAIMLITHDLGVVAEVADQVVVMYAGRKVEEAPVRQLFKAPKHPYTRGLLGAVPKLGSSQVGGAPERLSEIPGLVPSLKKRIEGCVFAGRCPIVTDLCRKVAPGLELKAPGQVVACHYAHKEALSA